MGKAPRKQRGQVGLSPLFLPSGIFKKILENLCSKVLTVTIESAYEWSIRPRVSREGHSSAGGGRRCLAIWLCGFLPGWLCARVDREERWCGCPSVTRPVFLCSARASRPRRNG